jgi:hypothetical protein
MSKLKIGLTVWAQAVLVSVSNVILAETCFFLVGETSHTGGPPGVYQDNESLLLSRILSVEVICCHRGRFHPHV